MFTTTKLFKRKRSTPMFIKSKQLSLFNTFESLKNDSDKPRLLRLLNEFINISDFIPVSLYNAYNLKLGKKRDFSLNSVIAALLIKQFLNIEQTSVFLNILSLSSELRDMCGFSSRIPSESFFSRFRSDFNSLLSDFFHNLVEISEPICRNLDKDLSDILIYDTSAIEPYVKENNPKYIASQIRKVKYSADSLSTSDATAIVYKSLPKNSSANSDVKKTFANGHFCYAYKFGIITNGLGIIRDIQFLKDLDEPSDDPLLQKYNSDTHSLKPILHSFFHRHTNFSFSTFLGDSEFDSYSNFSYLMNDLRFSKALIPLNNRGNSTLPKPNFDIFGYPLCPSNHSLPMVYWGKNPTKNSYRFKFICPKYLRNGSSITTTCSNPCTSSSYGRVIYTHPEQDFRTYPGIIRNSPEWVDLYKKRAVIEQSIGNLKLNFALNRTFSNKKNHIKADLILSACSQLLILILADKLSIEKPLKSVKALLLAS
jgi:hypothetical protein